MQPAGCAVAGAPKLPANLSIEDMLLGTGGDVTTITVIGEDGKAVGSIDRTRAIETVRQPHHGQS